MSSQGWISLHRQIQDNFLWQDKPFAMGQAWIDLLLLAYREDTKKIWRGELIECKRGSVNVSLTFLADRWGWSWRKVKRFLTLLENEGMIVQNVTPRRTAIFLTKYDVFQGERRADVRANVRADVRADVTQSIKINNIDNINKGASAPRKKSVKKKNYMESWMDALQAIDVEDENGESES